jgi:GNAT superfamily N-acetyltransferase
MSEPLYHIIDGLHDARSLVYATWLRSYQAASPQTKHVPREIYFREHHKVLDGIFARSPTIKLATMPDDSNVVFGWAVTENDTVHYVYVKPDFRRYGIARALLAHVPRPFTYTHWTWIVRDLEKHLEKCAYNPYGA